MWARIAEMGLAVWLALSPWVFAHPSAALFLWVNDLVCAGLILVLAWLPFHRSLEKLHLLQGAAALWLIGCALSTTTQPTPPAVQNHMVTGLLLLMFAVIPSRSTTPPDSWRRFYESRERPASTHRIRSGQCAPSPPGDSGFV